MPSYQKVVVVDSYDTDMYVQAADVSHQLQGNLRIKSKNEFISCSAVLSEDVAYIIMPLDVITSSDHTSVLLLRPCQKNCCNKWSVIQRQERSSNGQVRVWSYETKSKLIWKHSSCPKSTCLAYMRTHVLLMGRPRVQDGKNIEEKSTVRHFSDDFTLNHHLERTNDITYWLIHTICPSAIGMVGNSWMGSANQFATLSCRYFIRSHLVTA